MPGTTVSHAPPQIPGFLISSYDAQPLKEVVATLLERDNLRFPGAQPVSFAREHMAELQRQEYFMCEKTDGLRCLLFLHWQDAGGPECEPVTFMIDRKNNYYNITPPFAIPHYMHLNEQGRFLFDTILDGELVHDHYPGEPAPRLNYYIFDTLAVGGQNVTSKTLDKRLGRLQEWVMKPYHEMLKKIPNIKPDDLKPFALKDKKTYPAYSLQEMFNNVLPTLKHGNDGLIFTCKSTRYEFGTDRHILKWKPPQENTIDFKLRLGDFPLIDPADGEEGLIPDYDAMPAPFQLLVLHNQNNYQPFATLSVTPSEWDKLKSLNQRLDGRIIECFRTPAGQWKYKSEGDGTPRWRDDKKDANHISTVNSVLESIENPVTELDLLENQENIKKADYGRKGKQYHPPQDGGERDAKKRKFSQAELNGGPH
ncbi:mRNA-capping enzyme subunit alpha [Cucurbitaria berberidis CBS 394.84]|uniref:mRNA-capping enzyme subunit alpha n=1 Tax=Cucurbitaria berberidis CBS 394.84 TaxID=1168544 RepID=A0A9P4GL78_9PLEO|nr:mRNA-capping enzyme subunit alpha [Cucurbitaria berberidis CBS 394.84]KAF1847499.1 mRNA-capping enzyme subunit alpha [Cucurbitaria berberidis CBS 394.84]